MGLVRLAGDGIMGIETNLFGIKRKQMHKISKSEAEQKKFENFKLSDLEMQVINADIAVPYIVDHHYSKSCTRSISIAFGFYYRRSLVGVIVYASPVGSLVAQSMSYTFDLDASNVYELTRLFTDDRLPRNTESYCISKSIKYIKQNCPDVCYLVSYADSMYGHVGTIYQSSNWLYTGKVEPKVTFEYNGRKYHAKSLYDIYGTSSIPKLKEILGEDNLKVEYSNAKFRYVYVLGSTKSEHKLLMKELSYDILPYPKSDLEYYKMT